MARSLIVVASEPGAGKSVISLGLFDFCERQGARTAYFKPIRLRGGPEAVGRDARFVYGTMALRVPEPQTEAVSVAEVAGAIAEGRYREILDRLVAAHERLAEDRQLVITEGVDSLATFPALDADINVDLATRLGSALLIVARAHDHHTEQVAASILVTASRLRARGARVLGVLVNRADADPHAKMVDQLRRHLRPQEIVLYGVVPRIPELACLYLSDLVEPLALAVLDGHECLEAAAGSILLADMGLDHALHLVKDGSLIVAPGDRDDLLLAAGALFHREAGPRPVGVLLTGGFEPRRRVLALVRHLTGGALPILRTELSTYDAVLGLSRVEPRLAAEQRERTMAALLAMDEYVALAELYRDALDA